MAQDNSNRARLTRFRGFPVDRLWVWLRNLRTQVLLILIACLLVIGGVIAVLGGWVTHRLKQHLVEEAHALAREEVDRFSHRLAELARREGDGSLQAIVRKPEVQTQLRLLVRSQGAIRMMAILSPDGKVLIQQSQDQETAETTLGPRETLSGELMGDNTTYEVRAEQVSVSRDLTQESLPLIEGDVQLGFVQWGLADVAGSRQLQRLSTAITESLGWMVGLLLAILAATLALLYKVFNRHLTLEREKEAHARMASIGTLASGLAHEIRNPLQIINTNLDLIREEHEEAMVGQTDRARGLRILDGVQNQVRQLNSILADFLQFAIPGRLEMEPLALRPLVGGVVDFALPELEKAGVRVENHVPEDARAQGDSSGLRQVFLNIILNACQAMDASEEKRLTISATQERSGHWNLLFDDTGCGIPPGKEEVIFDALVSFRIGGTGFGLAIARRIIEEHGGHIWAEARREGRGAGIRLTLPPGAVDGNTGAERGVTRGNGNTKEQAG